MLMNNLDPEVAERPEELVVYGGSGKAARNWECFEAIVATLRRLGDDETLLVQSGKPVAVFKTHAEAPRVLIANSMLVPHWATADEFRRLEGLGLTMYGQMTAGSWIYIGTQGILQGTYETLAECRPPALRRLARRPAHRHRRPRRHGRRPAARRDHERGGLPGGRGRPLADRAPARHPLSRPVAPDIPTAVEQALAARDRREAISIAVEANAVDLLEHLLATGLVPDALTDQTSAHDALHGYVPHGISFAEALRLRVDDPQGLHRALDGLDGRPRARHARPPGARARSPSTTATTCAGRRWRPARRGPSTSAASCRCSSGRCSARGRGRSAGPCSPAIRRTSRRPTRRSSPPSRRTRRWRAGSAWPASASPSRGCRRASAGSATASAPRPGRCSTSWWRRGR